MVYDFDLTVLGLILVSAGLPGPCLPVRLALPLSSDHLLPWGGPGLGFYFLWDISYLNFRFPEDESGEAEPENLDLEASLATQCDRKSV